MSLELQIALPPALAQACGVAAVSALLDAPPEPGADAPVVLLHGSGTDSDHPSLRHLAAGWAARGRTVLRPRLPFRERIEREGRRRPPDPLPRLVAALETVLAGLPELHPALASSEPPVLAGRSLGARLASLAVAAGRPASALVWLAFPLHPPGQPERWQQRCAHFPKLDLPILAIQGERDGHARQGLLKQALERLPRAPTLRLLAGAGHGLSRPRDEAAAEFWGALSSEIDAWLRGRP